MAYHLGISPSDLLFLAILNSTIDRNCLAVVMFLELRAPVGQIVSTEKNLFAVEANKVIRIYFTVDLVIIHY